MSAPDSSHALHTAAPDDDRPPSLRVYFAVAAIIVVALMVILAIRRSGDVMGHFRRQALAEARLADGTILTLRVTYGRSHSLPMPRRFWPEWLGQQFPPFLERSTGDESLVLWFTRWDPATGRPVDFDWWLKCTVEDATGWRVEDREGAINRLAVRLFRSRRRSASGGGRPYEGDSSEYDCIVGSSVLRMFRCAGDSFRLKIYDADRGVVAEFDVPWPGPPSFPVWRPEPLPASKQVGDLTVTLRSFSAGRSGLIDERDWKVGVDPKFAITRDGSPAPWKVDFQWLTDALGNTAAGWNCDLSPREAAWKLHARLFRAAEAPPDPAEAWHVGEIAIPGRDRLDTLNRIGTVKGVRVELVAVGGPGSVVSRWTEPPALGSVGSGRGGSFPTSDDIRDSVLYHIQTDREGGEHERTVKSEAPHLFLKVPPLGPLQKLQLYIVDNNGNVLPGGIQRLDDPRDDVFWFFAPAEGTQSVNVSIAITDGREVEFLIEPPTDVR